MTAAETPAAEDPPSEPSQPSAPSRPNRPAILSLAAVRARLESCRPWLAVAARWFDRAVRGARTAHDALLDLTIPPTCGRCGADLADRRDLVDESPRAAARRAGWGDIPIWCERCARRLGLAADSRFAAPYQCRRCGATLSSIAHAARSETTGCGACFGTRQAPDSVVALGEYHGELRRWVIDAKRFPDAPLAVSLAIALARRIELEPRLRGCDRILAVPGRRGPSPRRDPQAYLESLRDRFTVGPPGALPRRLAERLARRLALPLALDLVQYRRFVLKQGKLQRIDRLKNVSGAMGWVEPPRGWLARALGRRSGRQDSLPTAGPQPGIAGHRWLVIDDVATSGATLTEVGRVLREAGAIEVHAAVLARAASFDDPPQRDGRRG
ncbi:MAG TPA: phosphoribosyltransferase family protein [Pirellulaceae bacterium]|nr:phosphoribosyltransferase family protein [Pirellulaceae bacterium]